MYRIIKFDEWLKNDIKIMFMFGPSGSGKTTLAKKLAKQYDAIHLNIDILEEVIEGKQKEYDLSFLQYVYNGISLDPYYIIHQILYHEIFNDKKIILDWYYFKYIPFSDIKSYSFCFVFLNPFLSVSRTVKRNISLNDKKYNIFDLLDMYSYAKKQYHDILIRMVLLSIDNSTRYKST